jgi:hypothetical protein
MRHRVKKWGSVSELLLKMGLLIAQVDVRVHATEVGDGSELGQAKFSMGFRPFLAQSPMCHCTLEGFKLRAGARCWANKATATAIGTSHLSLPSRSIAVEEAGFHFGVHIVDGCAARMEHVLIGDRQQKRRI